MKLSWHSRTANWTARRGPRSEHRAMRQRVQAAYSAELSEEIPDRLLKAAGGAMPAHNVARFERAAPRARQLRPRWRIPASMAASLGVGLAVGYFLLSPQQSPLLRNA